MRKLIISAVALASLVGTSGVLTLMTSTSAEASWYCSARGTTGAAGWGRSGSVGEAKQIALRECSVRTASGATCYIMYCHGQE
jgi:hypothetical protein